MLIANKYRILNSISEGEFGKVYKGENIRTSEKVAIKIESKDNPVKLLKHEVQVYQYLKKLSCIPTLKWYGVYNDYHYLVMPLYDCSLADIINTDESIGNDNIISIAFQMLDILQFTHNKEIIHRDIKPGNFVLDKVNNKLLLIDFGFAKRYMREDGEHISFIDGKQIIGTPNYISINVHNGYEPSRRDDVESVCYIIFFLYMNINSWIDIINNNEDELELDDILVCKRECRSNENINEIFRNIFIQCSNTSFIERPEYDKIIEYIELL